VNILPTVAVCRFIFVLFSFACAPAAAPTSLPHLKTVFLIMMENHSWNNIAGSPSAPYINNTLLPMAALADNYYTGVHPSLPNYLWLEAGTNFHVTADVSPAAAHQSSPNHLVTLLDRAHVTWKAYEQAMRSGICPLTNSYPYATKHNPMVYFDNVTNRGNPRSAYCVAHEVPFTRLASDLTHDSVARYDFITPDLCHDMHDACAPTLNQVKQGDTWLSQTIPLILQSRAYLQGGVILIVWDEGTDDSDGPLGLLAISPDARRGYSGHIRYTHSSTLRTVEEVFGLTRMLGAAAHSNDLRALFVKFP
jgi:phospholipase C